MSVKLIKILLFLFLELTVLIVSAQTGPGGIGQKNGTSSLQLWLEADKEVFIDSLLLKVAGPGEGVLLWKDRSGNNNHVRALTDSTLPTLSINNPYFNKQNAVQFYRNGEAPHKKTYLSSIFFNPSNDITIYCVFHALSKGGGNNVTPYKASTYDQNMWYYGAGLVDAGDPSFTNDVTLSLCDTSIAAGAGDSTTATDYCVKTPVTIKRSYFALLQKEALSGKLSIGHNNANPSVFQAGQQPVNHASRINIGATSDVNSIYESPFFDGYIAEVLIYNKILTTAEKIILENYLSSKYNLTLLNNDYYRFDETSAGDFDADVAGIGKAADGSAHLSSQGEGLVELNNALELMPGEFIFTGHNGKSLNPMHNDLPSAIDFKLERKWVLSAYGNTKSVDLIADAKELKAINRQNLALLIDTDNDGTFSDEKLGEGILLPSDITTQNRAVFRGVSTVNGNTYTFAQLKATCEPDCDAFFSPDGDGVADVYYLQDAGKTSIFDRAGKLIKTLKTPEYWDGTDDQGNLSVPGIYFLVVNDETTRTVTLIR